VAIAYGLRPETPTDIAGQIASGAELYALLWTRRTLGAQARAFRAPRRLADLGEERGHRTLAIVRKGGRRATVPLAPRTAAAVDAIAEGRDAGPLFVTSSGLRMDRFAAGKVVRRLARDSGLSKRVSPHSLRHALDP
jgi:integrase